MGNNLFQLFHIPDELVTIIGIIIIALTLAPYFAEIKILDKLIIPNLPFKQRKLFKALGPMLVVVYVGCLIDFKVYEKLYKSIPNNESSLDNGLVCFLPLQENTNDMSDFDNNGIANGATFEITNNNKGLKISACKFDGKDDFIELKKFNGLPNKRVPISISVWFKLDDYSTARPAIIGFGPDTRINQMEWFHLSLDRHNESVLVRINGDDMETNNVKIKTGTWNHIVLIYGEKEISLFINGENQKLDKQLSYKHTNYRWVIGRFDIDEPDYFKGFIRSVRIYNRSITTNEITRLFERD